MKIVSSHLAHFSGLKSGSFLYFASKRRRFKKNFGHYLKKGPKTVVILDMAVL